MMPFFLSGECRDDLYRTIRDGNGPSCLGARELLERLWAVGAPYLDGDFRHQAASSFEPRFWEMYLVAALLENGISLIPRSHLPRSACPDFRMVSSDAWIEAVLATSGVGDNAVPDRFHEGGGWVPEEEMILRLRNAIQRKAEKYEEYLQSGTVRQHDPYVVAVGARLIPLGMAESSPPRIVSALFPIGPRRVVVDVNSGEVVHEGRQHRPVITTAAGSPVSTNIFQEDGFRGISGVLYASVDELNRPERPGPEFIFLHNPLACNPLPEGVYPFGREYRKVGEELQVRLHRRRDA